MTTIVTFYVLVNVYNLCTIGISNEYSTITYNTLFHRDLLMPRTRTVTYVPRSFAVSGPTTWNTLSPTLRVSATTLGQFHSGLKTILFRLAYGT